MKVDYIVLADAASASDGKHYIHGGGWDTLYARVFPLTYQQIAVALRLRAKWQDTHRRHLVQLDVIDERGQSILPADPEPLSATITPGRPSAIKPGTDQVFPIALNLQELQFMAPGSYTIVVRINQHLAARYQFTVALAE